ncbi:penicillin-binding protein 2 [Candidatus Gottesmanbacteria bacterium]|nr:penicillin-binding protein 2 [Candidatus Gottesmanbacteria bacterium]
MWRLWAVFSIFVVLFAAIVLRLLYWTTVKGDELRAQAAFQYVVERTLPASRGGILSSDGSPLVINQPAYLVYGEPKRIKDMGAFVRSVSPVLALDGQLLSAQLSDPNRVWVPIAHKVEAPKVSALKALDLTGLGFEKEPKRYYPEASMAAQILGFVGSDVNGHDKGYFGLEGYYDRELRGKDGMQVAEKDVRGAPILVGNATRIEAEDGRTLVLWIDRMIQGIVERRLQEGMRKYGASEGTVVVMDPATGGILAMATYPSYDPQNFKAFEKSLYKNPIVASAYEPGSTFKVLVMAAAIQEKLVTPAATMEETGPVSIGDYTIRTWNDLYHGTITMTKVLEYSSNVGMVYVANKLGKEKTLSYIRNFGFGAPTGIDVEEESAPQLRKDSEWGVIDLATTSFGQGIAVTPIQMVRAAAAIANDGWLMEPHVVKEIRDSRGRSVSVRPKKVRQVIQSATANVISEMMVAAVDNGEAKWAKPKGYRIAGKTGTAQIPVAGHYDENKTIASFVGFAPADNPKFVMLVTLREPKSSPWGSETAAPLFFTIARDLFHALGLPPQY